MKETKTRKKSVILAAIVLLLVAVLALGATTYAKYVTSGKVETKQATVAKWGFTVTANADNLFGEAYNQGVKVAKDATAIDVKASTADTNVVAPGTSGSMTVTVNGSAEVLAKLTVTATGKDVALTKTADSSVYNPVKWTVKKGETALVTDGTLTAVVEELNKITTEVAIGTTVNDTYTISWAWAFEAGETDADKTANNEKDTILGQIANGQTVDGYTAETQLSFELTVSVEQIQNS